MNKQACIIPEVVPSNENNPQVPNQKLIFEGFSEAHISQFTELCRQFSEMDPKIARNLEMNFCIVPKTITIPLFECTVKRKD